MVAESKVLIVLGGQNDTSGRLSQSAIERLDACFALYEKRDKILCTGGWGKHFNTLEQPHAFFARHYLLSKGLEGKVFLPFALSAHTVDDAVKVKEILQKHKISKAVVITSDFHMQRVQLIFQEVLSGFELQFHAAKSALEQGALAEAIAHEQKAIKSLKENGLYY